MGDLERKTSLRVLSTADFHKLVARRRPFVSPTTVRSIARLLIKAGALHQISAGLYLNQRMVPPASLLEAAGHLRRGAVISLHSVLGECGFLNNPSAIVTAVLPTSISHRPKLGQMVTSSQDRFAFYGLPEKFFPQNAEQAHLMLQPGRPCAMFRPEAALLQWLHLGSSGRSNLPYPPFDVDMEQLDQEHLNYLAKLWNLEDNLDQWLKQAREKNFGAEPETFVTAARVEARAPDSGMSARDRILARRLARQ